MNIDKNCRKKEYKKKKWYPNDIKAINEFLVMAFKEIILRYGEFEYGNQ